MTTKVSFPLPSGYFGPMTLTPQMESKYRLMIETQLTAALEEEQQIGARTLYDVTPPATLGTANSPWFHMRKKNKIHIYKRDTQWGMLPTAGCASTYLDGDEICSHNHLDEQESSPHSSHSSENSSSSCNCKNSRLPTILAVGKVEGTIEELLYGCYSPSYEELRLLQPFQKDITLDAAVLHNIDLATAENPFQYLGLKWRLTKTNVLRPRDLCYLEAIGTGTDLNGSKYAYWVTHSVRSTKNCPPFHPETAVRSQISFTIIFRQDDTNHDAIDVFCLGDVRDTGDPIEGMQFINNMSSAIFAQLSAAVQCGATKKMTWLAAHNSFFDCLGEVSTQQRGVTSQRKPKKSASSTCTMCSKKASLLSSLKTCRMCSSWICRRCSTKQLIFDGPKQSLRKVTCCPGCLIKAHEMTIEPSQIDADLQRAMSECTLGLKLTWSSSDSDERSTTASLSEFGNSSLFDTDMEHFYSSMASSDGFLERASTMSFMSEDEMEAAFDTLLRESRSGSSPPILGRTYDHNSIDTVVWKDQTRAQAQATHQRALFYQLVAIHRKCQEVSETTRRNGRIMRLLSNGDGTKEK